MRKNIQSVSTPYIPNTLVAIVNNATAVRKIFLRRLKTVDKAQEYIDMFNKANELLKEHKKLIIKNRILPYLDFTRKIYNKLENKDVYWLLTDTEIIENMLNNGYSHNLEFSRVEKKSIYK